MLDFAASLGTAPTLSRGRTILECEPGVVRLFGAADIGTRGQIDGWAEPEDGHVWNNGLEATLLIGVPARSPRLLLSIAGEPYVTRIRPAQEVTLFGNGLRIGFWRLSQRREVTLSVPLEPEWWLRRGRLALMQLGFHLPLSMRPRDAADGPDEREIGLCLRSICLRPLPDDTAEAAGP